MSFELAVILSISATVLFLVYTSVNSQMQRGLKTLFTFLSLFLLLIVVNLAMVLARDATANTELDALLSTVHITLVWIFTFIAAIFGIIEFTGWFKNGKISVEKDTYRTR